MEPEKELWIAVLAQAVRDTARLLKKVQKEPELWSNHLFRSDVRDLKRFFRDRSMAPGSFCFICSLMSLDPEQAAQRIEEKYLRHLVPVSKCSAHLAA
ncbi:MAG: hypothetical protein HQL80_05845 [Magnetococcales bacterium]|nr:hypothetical protein [Magnetococcales bacterium]